MACLAEGKHCAVGNSKLPGPAERIEFGNGANVVRGEVIRFFAYGGNEKNPVLGDMIELHGAWVCGAFDLTHANISYPLHFNQCHFADYAIMLHAKCDALYLDGSRLTRGLRADGLTTKGNVHLRNVFSIESEVRLLDANIGGDLSCVGGKFHNSGGNALIADRLTAKGDVNLRDGFTADGAVRLLGADIGGNLNCAGGTFYNPDEYALVANGLTAKGDIYLCNNFSAKGIVQLLNANVGGILDCTGGEFHNPNGNALVVDGVTTKGDMNLGNGFFAKGQVRLLDANIGRSLNCVGGKFHNAGGCAFSADRLTTKGNVHFREGFSAEGEVRLGGANIGGDLSCAGGNFHNPGGNALVADGLTTKGNVHFNEGFSAEGEVRLLGADIGKNLSCLGGKFHNPDGNALNVDNGNINGALLWRGTICEGDVNLAYARADLLADGSDSWKSCKVNLDGFTYNRFSNPMDALFRIDWLAKRPDEKEFSPQPYEQAAKVLRAMGKGIDAWDIERKKNRLQRKFDGVCLFQKLGGRFLDILQNGVYRPSRVVMWGICVVAFGTMVFTLADYHGNIVPTDSVVTLSEDYKRKVTPNCGLRPTQAVTPEYSAFNPLVFSLDVFTPSAVFHQEDSWAPRSGGGYWKDFDFDILWFLMLWYWFEIMAGWVLTSLFLLSVPSLLRPRLSSDEKD